MLTPIAGLASRKAALREQMKAERAAAAQARPDAARQAAANFMRAIPVPAGAIVALYHPLKDELDTGPLVDALAVHGASVALPVVAGAKKPLMFRAFTPGDALARRRFGVMEPMSGAGAAHPSIIVVPLVAFTRGGARLGYGGGHYDRTLVALRRDGGFLAIGYGYAAQEVDAIPQGRQDETLDWVVTEREAIRTVKA